METEDKRIPTLVVQALDTKHITQTECSNGLTLVLTSSGLRVQVRVLE